MNNPVQQDVDDGCLGYFDFSGGPGNGGFYHYYSFSPCIKSPVNNINTKFGLCFDGDNECADNFNKTVTDVIESLDYLEPIGIAKDGHLIVGPWNENAKYFQPCDLDACNGFIKDNKYYYVASVFHPYTVGCWGPAQSQLVK